MKRCDDRQLSDKSYDILHRIKRKMIECEKANVDYDEYVPVCNLKEVEEILDCCLKKKDSKWIARLK